MGRTIKTQNGIWIAEQTASIDDYKDKLVKLIPSEIITAYFSLQAMIKGGENGGDGHLFLWIIFIVLILLNPLYLDFISKVTRTLQIVFTTIAFILWVILISGPIEKILGFDAAYIGSIFLVLYTLIIPFVFKGQSLV